jgi:hypothetical protein
MVVLGAGFALRPAPVARAHTLLHRFGKRSGIDFACDARGRLMAGSDFEVFVSRMVWRTTRSLGVVIASLGLSRLLLLSGPPLSRSTVLSLVVAGVAVGGVVGPYFFLRPFLRPFTGGAPGASTRAIRVEDYVSPVRRVMVWLAGTSALVIPFGAVALATTEHFDGSKVYWEGLVGLPLASAGVLLAVELGPHGLRDNSTDSALLYLWDALRGHALRMITGAATIGVAISWQIASAGLVGVALNRSSLPDWVVPAHDMAAFLSLILVVTGVGLLVMPTRRFRARLWSGLAPGQKVRVGLVPG